MFEDVEAQRKEKQLAALADEEAHYGRISRVFRTADGIEVLAWILELAGYWTRGLSDERACGRFELGRAIFDHVSVADIDISHRLLDRRHRLAVEARNAERNRIEGR